MSLIPYALVGALTYSLAAFGSAIVIKPDNGAQVVSPFDVNASATDCSSQSVIAMGYSIDESIETTILQGGTIRARVIASVGAHTLHVKSWGGMGAPCVTDIAIYVIVAAMPLVPVHATAVANVQALPGWRAVYDTATGSGTSNGAMSIVSTPSLSGAGRQFATSYTNSSGERYFVSFGSDTASTDFLYDGWVYLASPSAGIANLELDMNQVMSNGQTVIYGIQCDGWSGTWDYTENAGSPQKYNDHWVHSKAPCNPRKWSENIWHHIQLSYSRDDVGNVTYNSVWLDGVVQNLNVTVPSSFALGWSPTLLTNFQVDGVGSMGSAIAYLDHLTIYRWTNDANAPPPFVPASAIAVPNIQSSKKWLAANDPASGNGSSTGTMSTVSTPSLSGSGLEFDTSYTNSEGERYYASFGADMAATNFFYDGQFYLAAPSNGIANLDFELNQVMPNGQTVIYALQCNGSTGTWNYTENAGTPQQFDDQWLNSTAACNPQGWSENTWHRVQISFTRDDLGNVTYNSVWLDGAQQDLNLTVPSAFALGWKSTLITNFQVDGNGLSGSSTAYLDNLTIYRW